MSPRIGFFPPRRSIPHAAAFERRVIDLEAIG
jgi:hypothetical protein